MGKLLRIIANKSKHCFAIGELVHVVEIGDSYILCQRLGDLMPQFLSHLEVEPHFQSVNRK